MTRSRPDVADAPFALLLTHDVDRPYKTYQSLYYAVTGDDSASRRYHLSSLLSTENPYWQFDRIASIEDELGVRSAFYFLSEQSLFADRPLREWVTMDGWMLYAGGTTWTIRVFRTRSSCSTMGVGGGAPRVLRIVSRRRAAGRRKSQARGRAWPAGPGRPTAPPEPRGAGDVAAASRPRTPVRREPGEQRRVRLPARSRGRTPFDDEFVVFPLTIMEQSLPDPGADFETAWDACLDVLDEAREETAVASVLWHPRHFSRRDFPDTPGCTVGSSNTPWRPGRGSVRPASSTRRLTSQRRTTDRGPGPQSSVTR